MLQRFGVDEETAGRIAAEIHIFNTYESSVAELEYHDEYLALVIDGETITEGEIEVLNRIRQINHELGNDLMEG